MKRMVILILNIILVLMMTACNSQKCTCACCKTQTERGTASETTESSVPQDSESLDEKVENLEDSCENPSGASHYPYITWLSKGGNVGTVSITTAEHGATFDGFLNGFGTYVGTGLLDSKKCYSTAEKANAEPIQIDSRGHEIIITISYGQNTEKFTLKAGDSQLLSIQELSYLTNRAYIYVIVI
ncbi:MAG: hypothetical protein HFJ30_05820 [Clostridia bacterium]|jgi:hypothetical protein|nr:hypothetical protein [Clostridia bacterium]